MLYVIATPIGCIEDITEHAKSVLSKVDYIACEDTRKTNFLLCSLNIKQKLIRADEYNMRQAIDKILRDLNQGQSIAYVCDAGTPGISDPVDRLVDACYQAGLDVQALPGPSSVTTALSICGFLASPFTFWGFLAKKGKQKTLFLKSLDQPQMCHVFFESPHRILQTLKLLSPLTQNRRFFLARELTKTHQEILRGHVDDILNKLDQKPAIKGEFTVVLERPNRDE